MTNHNDHQPSPRFRFSSTDRLVLDGVDYVVQSSTKDGHTLVPTSNTNLPNTFLTHEDIAQMLRSGQLQHYPNWHQDQRVILRRKQGTDSLCELQINEQKIIHWRTHFCEQFLQMEGGDKNISRSDASMTKTIARIAADLYQAEISKDGKAARCGRPLSSYAPPSPTSLRRWLRQYIEGGGDPLALRPVYRRSGNRTSRLDGDSMEMANKYAWCYASQNQDSKAKIYLEYKNEVEAENAKRSLNGQPCLKTLGLRSFEKLIGKLPVFEVYAGRHGIEKARLKFSFVNRGLDVTRALERVEMDEYHVSLQTILVDIGIWEKLDAAQKATVSRTRAWLTVAIDCATKCILAMRLLDAPPNHASAISTLEMAIFDKSELAETIGTTTPLDIYGTLESLITDSGAAFVSAEFRSVLRDIGILFMSPPAKLPHLRANIERLFRTIGSQLLAHFPGQTFANIVVKGDYDSEANAVINLEELNRTLIRYAVDIYHNSPHDGLAGETPRNAWLRLTNLYGVKPPPSEDIRRHVFGISDRRQISNRGIQFMRLHYQSVALQQLRSKVGQKKVLFRINRHDLGSISVKTTDGWLSVPSTFSEISGTSYWEWVETVQDLLRRNAATSALAQSDVQNALRDIRSQAAMATKRAEIAEPVLSLADIQKVERDLMRSFAFAKQPEPSDEDLLGDDLPFVDPQISPQPDWTEGNEFGDPKDWLEE